jgi:uncharacterized membrane protein ywcD
MEKLISLVFNRETISYVVFGLLTTVVSILSYEIIKRSMSRGKEPTQLIINIATVGSWIFAVAFAFITNKVFVFQSTSFEFGLVISELAMFVGARLLSLGYEIVWMNVTTGVLKWNDSLCKIIAQFVIVALNYIFSKLFIFS